ncbi:MAG TPA: MFS transporter [Baekduia sp.]|nr:MFS transporter [Baekduia sp.]
MELAAPPPPAAPGDRDASLADDPRRWWALAVLLLAQVTLILDIAIVNVAVPAAQAELRIAPTDIQWLVTAYLLPFGALLLLGGRVADLAGRKRVFCVAAAGFAAASAAGGAAEDPGVLFAARAVQGTFAAAMAPALLSMLSLGFPSGPQRTRAFSLYGGVSAAGGALGLLLGGVLTEYLSWRWSLLINVPICAVVLMGAVPLLRESAASTPPRFDLGGAVLATSGLLALIYGISTVAEEGWASPEALLPQVAGAVLLTAFVGWEARAAEPLMPLSLLGDRTRAGGLVISGVGIAVPTAMALLVLVFLQGPLDKSPFEAGLHFLPLPVAGLLGAFAALQLTPVVSTRVVLAAGTATTALGVFLVGQLDAGSSLAGGIAPGLALVGFGDAILFVAGNAIAMSGVPERDAGLASAVVNATQQVCSALAVAVLSTVAASAATGYLADHGPEAAGAAIAHGNHRALVLATLVMLAFGALAAALVAPRTRVTAHPVAA